MLKLILFCEAKADAHTALGLLDRVIKEHGPAWVADLIDQHPEAIRQCIEDRGRDRNYFDLHALDKYIEALKIRTPYGYFKGEPGEADAQMARTVFTIVRKLSQKETIHLALIVRDMDDQADRRQKGLTQARDEALGMAAFESIKIILGQANPMREAWVLAGFDPENSEESETLKALRQELGFCPCEHSHKLGAKDEQAKKNPKRILSELTANHPEREARCWTDARLERLHARGLHNGLSPFLNEAQTTLPPLLQQEQK